MFRARRYPSSVSVSTSVSPARTGLSVCSVLVCVWLGVGGLAATAQARTGHVFSSAFAGSGGQALSGPAGVAVNDETGDVYVVDRGHNRVEEFNSTGSEALAEFNGAAAPTGVFSAPEAIAVDNCKVVFGGRCTALEDPSVGDVYVTDTSHRVVDKFSASGAYLGQITEGEGEAPFARLDGVAVDAGGAVWVSQETREIDSYSDALTNAFVSARTSVIGVSPGLAVDAEDDLYVSAAFGEYEKLDSSGGYLIERLGGEGSTGAAADLSSGGVYFDNVTSVVQLSSSGALLERFGAGHLTDGAGVAVNDSQGAAASGAVYVADATGNDVAVFLALPSPEVSLATASGLMPTSATLKGAVNPQGSPVTACAFEYGTSSSYGSTAPCSPPPGAGASPVPVSATLAGLSPDTTYHYRLLATNEHGTGETADHQVTTTGPGIGQEQTTSVEATAATLQAQIDPDGAQTSYHFEFDTSPYEGIAAHGTEVPAPDASIGAGTSAVPVSTRLTGLRAGTTYYYRVVAVSEIEGKPEAFDGPGKALVTPAPPSTTPPGCANEQRRAEQDGQGLPDCRAYELVSPLKKNGNQVYPIRARASLSGEALTYESPGSFAEPRSARLQARYLARRTPAGWSTQNLSPPYASYATQLQSPFEELLFTPDLSRGAVVSIYTPLMAGEPEGYDNTYLADTETGSYERVSSITPPGVRPYEEGYKFESTTVPQLVGASTDLSDVVFEQSYSLCCGASPGHLHVYEWAGGAPRLVDVPPGGGSFQADADVGAAAGGKPPLLSGDVWHAVSADGSRVFFTESHEGMKEQLYVRENPMSAESPYVEGKCTVPGGACTIEVSASQRVNPEGRAAPDPHGPQPAFYRGASADGSRVFFTSRAELTTDAYTGPEDNAANLYEYNVNTGTLTDLTVDQTDTDGAGVLGLVTAGEEGTYIYFVANGVLSDAPSSEGAKAVSGNCNEQPQGSFIGEPLRTCNLYGEHYNGSAWEAPRFIASLAGGYETFAVQHPTGDEEDWVGYEEPKMDFGPLVHSARVTPDGGTLVFMSERSLTGYDNAPAKAGQCGRSRGCSELYMYSMASGSLHCVSCNPSGARPTGASAIGLSSQLESGEDVILALTGDRPLYLPRYLTENGRRLFFESKDALVPSDRNGLRDVYEWEDAGEGGCEAASSAYSASDGGCLFPISDVVGGHESRFMDASPSGDDVFIVTKDALVPETEADAQANAYDVRIDGGFPVPVAAPACSNADSCKPPVSPQPSVFGAPASATFSGPGNPQPTPPGPPAVAKKSRVKCKTHFVMNRRGRCVRRKARKAARRAGAHVERGRKS